MSKATYYRLHAVRQLTLAVALMASAAAHAGDGSNLANPDYPEVQCEKPSKPTVQLTLSSQAEFAAASATINHYNERSAKYTACVNRYLSNAEADVRRIQARMDAAVAQANSDSSVTR